MMLSLVLAVSGMNLAPSVLPTMGAAASISVASVAGVLISGPALDSPALLSAALPQDMVYAAFMAQVDQLNHFG
jgi:hypothetical protein